MGWLFKLGGGQKEESSRSRWNKRFFVLHSHLLVYFKNEEGARGVGWQSPSGVIRAADVLLHDEWGDDDSDDNHAKWQFALAHPGGDNLLLGSYDKRLCWFDMDLSTSPYRTLRSHALAVRAVCYHPQLPLFASASDDASVHVYHGRVYSDLMSNALIVPLKILKGHEIASHLGVMDIAWHPTQPWLFSAGADGSILLYTG